MKALPSNPVAFGVVARRVVAELGERLGFDAGEDRAAYKLDDLWHDGVSEAAQSVHPLGYPMSHSTHVGFSAPEPSDACTAWSRRSLDRSLPFLRVREAGLEPLCIDATGVGQIPRSSACTASAKFSPKPVEARRIIVSSFVPGPADRLSIALGVGQGARKFRGDLPAERSATAFVLLASGVGNNPDSVASVRRTNGARWYAMPFRVIPERGQLPENDVQPSTKQRCHVLQDDEAGSNHANGSNHFPEESRTGSGKPGACPGERDVLAGKASADDVGIGILGCRHVADVRRIGEAKRKNARGVRVQFGDRHGLETSRPLQPEVEAADACEQGKDAQLLHLAPPPPAMRLALKEPFVGFPTGASRGEQVDQRQKAQAPDQGDGFQPAHAAAASERGVDRAIMLLRPRNLQAT